MYLYFMQCVAVVGILAVFICLFQPLTLMYYTLKGIIIIILIIIIIMLCKEKIRKQAGVVFTPPHPSQNYQEVELH